jgi:hypothetical protein
VRGNVGGQTARQQPGGEIGSQPEAADIAARVAELSREMAMVKQRLAALETDSID